MPSAAERTEGGDGRGEALADGSIDGETVHACLIGGRGGGERIVADGPPRRHAAARVIRRRRSDVQMPCPSPSHQTRSLHPMPRHLSSLQQKDYGGQQLSRRVSVEPRIACISPPFLPIALTFERIHPTRICLPTRLRGSICCCLRSLHLDREGEIRAAGRRRTWTQAL